MTTFDFNDIDSVIAALDDKIVRTDQGSYISVDDLKEFQKQVRETKEVEQQKPRITSFAQAREMAKRDPMFARPPAPPNPPAFASVKGVTEQS